MRSGHKLPAKVSDHASDNCPCDPAYDRRRAIRKVLNTNVLLITKNVALKRRNREARFRLQR